MTFVTDMAAKRAELSPDRTAFVDVASGVHLTFGEVEERANRMARALMELGARRGDRVALLARNHADVFVLLFASQKSGVLLLPLNWRQPAAELAPTVALAAPFCCCTMKPAVRPPKRSVHRVGFRHRPLPTRGSTPEPGMRVFWRRWKLLPRQLRATCELTAMLPGIFWQPQAPREPRSW